ncbi:MAG: glycosyltransferase family 2 protein [Gallionellaceae bacterium]
MSAPELSIIIVSYNTRDMLRECLHAVFERTTGIDFEVIVVDNASADGSPDLVREAFPKVHLIALNHNVGFGQGNNIAVEAAQGRYLFLLNSDAILLGNSAFPLVEYLEKHLEISCVGPRIVLPDGAVQPKAFGYLPSPWRLLMQSLGMGYLGITALEGVDGIQRGGVEIEVGWVSGVCLCLRRKDYLSVGGFDERFFMYGEDVALCAQLHRKKGRVVLLDDFDVLHYGGASSPNLSSRIRNAVWQQRHILTICQDECGWWARTLAACFVVIGLLLRIVLALMLTLSNRIKHNAKLHINWARLLDILGKKTIPDSSQIASRGSQHANRN